MEKKTLKVEIKFIKDVHQRSQRWIDGIEIQSLDHLVNIAVHQFLEIREGAEADRLSFEAEIDSPIVGKS